jgi:hypothetical protein
MLMVQRQRSTAAGASFPPLQAMWADADMYRFLSCFPWRNATKQ